MDPNSNHPVNLSKLFHENGGYIISGMSAISTVALLVGFMFAIVPLVFGSVIGAALTAGGLAFLLTSKKA